MKQVVSQSQQTLPKSTSVILQRKCACGGAPGPTGECAECQKKRMALQRKEKNSSTPSEVPPIVHEVLQSSGQPLDKQTRDFFEPRFGHDFSGVRVHTDSRADESARAINALAYTVGRDVVFGSGNYDLATWPGRRLLAHELTHTVQQHEVSPLNHGGVLSIQRPDSAGEAEAEAFATSLTIEDLPFESIHVHARTKFATIQRYESGEHAQFGDTHASLQKLVADFSYQVKPKDTILMISKIFGISIEELLNANKSKVRKWKSKGKTVEGFRPGESITIPQSLNQATKNALAKTQITFKAGNVELDYGMGIAMGGDLFERPDQMLNAPETEIRNISGLIEKERLGTSVADSDWERATSGRYLDLAKRNDAHFAPPNVALVASSSKTGPNYKSEWEKYHLEALNQSQSGDINKALAINAFGDHFLTDAFSAGHLINKQDVIEKFRIQIAGNIEAFFNGISSKAFTGDLKKDFSEHESFDYKGVIFRPNIDSTDRFSKLLQGIYAEEPVLIFNAVVKSVHDSFNRHFGGVAVENKVGDTWSLSGDGTLNSETKRIAQMAVAQSQLNVLQSHNLVGPLDRSELFGRVWTYTPQPTKTSESLINAEISLGTDPTGAVLIDRIAKLITENYKAILAELIKRRKLKKA
jgi:Domain of unknown function (DUF4157)